MPNYLVAVGSVLIRQEAVRPQDAIALVKQRIEQRGKSHDPQISFGLHQVLLDMQERGQEAPQKLHFLVMDEGRSQLLCGEHNGNYEAQVSIGLALEFSRLITPKQFANSGL
jgi:hypothetical protein